MEVSLKIVLVVWLMEIAFICGVWFGCAIRRQDVALLEQALSCLQVTCFSQAISQLQSSMGNCAACAKENEMEAKRIHPRPSGPHISGDVREHDILSPAGKAIAGRWTM